MNLPLRKISNYFPQLFFSDFFLSVTGVTSDGLTCVSVGRKRAKVESGMEGENEEECVCGILDVEHRSDQRSQLFQRGMNEWN